MVFFPFLMKKIGKMLEKDKKLINILQLLKNGIIFAK